MPLGSLSPRDMAVVTALGLSLSGCGLEERLGPPPPFTPILQSDEHVAMMSPDMPRAEHQNRKEASLWSGTRNSLLGDRRALRRGDILTVVIEIDDKAEISNSSSRSRSGSERMSMSQLFGIPQRLNDRLPNGASLEAAVDVGSASQSSGDGAVRRKEKLTLRIAATIVDVFPNGVLSIRGSQEVRVNYEMRELLVSGFVRPGDISRQNEITYDKIGSARVSYGGRGAISEAQRPRYGQQVLDAILPF